MKLKKVLKHIDSISNLELYLNDKLVWKGNTVDAKVWTDSKKEREKYFKECKEDGYKNLIKDSKKVKKYLDYKLDTGDDYDAIQAMPLSNVITYVICIKEK